MIELETKTITCEKHGDIEVRFLKGHSHYNHKCSHCREEEEFANDKKQEEVNEAIKRKYQQERIAKNFQSALIPLRFQQYTFDNFLEQTKQDIVNKQTMLDYAVNFENNLKNGISAILSGSIGTGKTHLSCAVANYIIKNLDKTAVFLNTIDVFAKIKATYTRNSEITEIEAINQFNDIDLLILDEFGVQHGTDTEKMIFFRIINKRYENLKPTILISNLSVAELKKIDERVFDRLKHNGILLVFAGESKRKPK